MWIGLRGAFIPFINCITSPLYVGPVQLFGIKFRIAVNVYVTTFEDFKVHMYSIETIHLALQYSKCL